MNRMGTPAIVAIAAPIVVGIAALGISAIDTNPDKALTSQTVTNYPTTGDVTAGDTTANDTKAAKDTTANDTTAAKDARASHTKARETGSTQRKLTALQREKAELAEHKAKVTKAVSKKYPHARILRVVLRSSGTWEVSLRLRDHRTGFVGVDRHLHVGTFVQVPAHATKTAAPQPHKATPTPTTLYGKHW